LRGGRQEKRVKEPLTLCSATLGEDGKREPPLGPLYIAAALEAVGMVVDFRDYQLEPGADSFSAERLVRFLEGHAPVVAISCFVGMLPVVIEATRRLAALRPQTEFILGGPGPTGSANRILELYPWISGVVRGEGEETIQEWIQRRRAGAGAGSPIPGMSCRDGPTVVAGPDRQRVTALESLAPPAYHLADWASYSYARVITTRGCAYRCSFCDVTALWRNRSVYRDLDAVIDEMLSLRDDYGKHVITIVDDTFVQDRKRVRAFCDRMIERRARIAWSCFGRINLMSADLLDRMAEAGCNSIFYGIDSGSPAVLARTHKMVRAESVVPVIRHSASVFDHVDASFIWGYPFEELDDFKMTVDLVARVSEFAPRVKIQLHMLSPLPNSPIFREFADVLQEPEPEDRPWLLLPGVLIDPRAEEIGKLVREAPDLYPGFFTLPTPAKAEKREMLGSIMRSLDRTMGRTLLDERIGGLLERESPQLERELIEAETDPCGRIGVGLAVGFLRRSRRRRGVDDNPFEGTRGMSLVRDRSDEQVIVL
jgi:radical SAM superfamily enzyme YgiQ (UPF0313 family)